MPAAPTKLRLSTNLRACASSSDEGEQRANDNEDEQGEQGDDESEMEEDENEE
jgi:hypothetical protein